MEEKLIEVEDLKYLEKDLTREELIGLVFLLYGATDQSSYALMKLLEKQPETDFLRNFALNTINWKSIIIEALATIKAYECIKNLGIFIEEARKHVRTRSSLNPTIKLLYQLCEVCSKDLTLKFISYLKDHCPVSRATNENELEIYFLYCIVDKVIKINSCEFSVVINFFDKIPKTETIEKILQDLPTRPNTLDNNSQSKNFDIQNVQSSGTESSGVLGIYNTRKMMVLIINQQKFHREKNEMLKDLLPEHDLRERRGTAKDLEALMNLFKTFNYDIIIRSDLTHIQILQEISDVTKKSSQYDGLIISILSHGYEGLIYGSNSIPVQIKDIKESMASRGLLNKPKILIIQACQGATLQKTVTTPFINYEYDAPTQSDMISGSTRADFLLFWSTIEGFASIRHTEKGSWFIQELVKKIQELHNNQHLMDICTAVTNEVSSKRGYKDECMVPKLESTFIKIFRFPSATNETDPNSSVA